MVQQLEIVHIDGKAYYADFRLRQFRSVESVPVEFIDFEDFFNQPKMVVNQRLRVDLA